MFVLVLQEELRDFWHKGVLRIGVREERRNRKKHLRNREGRRPLVFQNVKADGTVRVHVAVVDFGHEMHFRRLEWIIRWKRYVEKENSSRIR